jgi:uncharacterized protein (DUF1697 family)
MPRHVAFLRAINVGGHTVKMDRLRDLFESLAFSNVETFIASGNVLFDAKAAPPALERKIERHLAETLGYEVATFIRSPSELAAVANHPAFPAARLAKAHALWIGLLKAAPNAEAVTKLMAIGHQTDDFHVHGREVYWLRHVTSSESKVSGAMVERALGAPVTARNITTIRTLAKLG